ncbi:MAG: N-acetylneuraminate synthase family protein [Spirochaetales bacterium]|nr:N-acetylneuraminate synthase family protein [Spirochaetales bacterium]
MDIYSFLSKVLSGELYEKKKRNGEVFFIIAEIGHNHQGSYDTCKELIKHAAEAGVDAVKLQKRDIDNCYTNDFLKSEYNSPHAFGKTYQEHREYLELTNREYFELKKYAEGLGLVFFATVFDIPSADFMNSLGSPCFKISSGDLTNTILLDYVMKLGKPVILSTGAATLAEIQHIYNRYEKINPHIALLHCVANYPCSLTDLNLNVIPNLIKIFPNSVIGLSDHCIYYESAIMAYMLGGRIIEKHFTLNKTMKGSDHFFSLELNEMKRLVFLLKNIPGITGSGVKEFCASEKKAVMKMRKKLLFSRDLERGHAIQMSDLETKSPGDGLSPIKAEEICGMLLKENVKKGMDVKYEHFE